MFDEAHPWRDYSSIESSCPDRNAANRRNVQRSQLGITEQRAEDRLLAFARLSALATACPITGQSRVPPLSIAAKTSPVFSYSYAPERAGHRHALTRSMYTDRALLQSETHCILAPLAAARTGDHEAFSTLVSPHTPRLQRLARRFTGSAEDAEDICQESLLKAFNKINQFAGTRMESDEFRAWLMRITANCAIDFLRRRGNRSLPFDECEHIPGTFYQAGASGWGESPETSFTRLEQLSILADAFAKLRPELRNVCLLRNVMELSTKEVAARLGISAIAVRVRLFRAHGQLRKILDRRNAWRHTQRADSGSN